MSPGVTLQLFPPPQKVPSQQTSPIRRPRVKPPTPEPSTERERTDSANSAKSAKAPVDFHELIIQVNSVTVPESAHIPRPQITRTPPQQSRSTFEPPPQPRAPTPTYSRTASPSVNADRNGSPSPVFSIQPTYNGMLGPINTSPDLTRSASPAFSDIVSARSGSPTLVRANSAATYRSPVSPEDAPPMRSIFPVYNPTVPLAQQHYHPTETSPTHIPREKISRSPYSPELYVPHSNVLPGPGSSGPSYKPYYTPAPLLDNLWLAANGQEEPAVQIYTLKMHRATATSNMISFGPTPSLPFYSLTQSTDPSSNSAMQEQLEHEVLIKRHHPTQPRALPVTHLSLVAPPPANAAFQQYGEFNEVSSSLLTSIYPKLAALAALDAAANSPAASQLAWVDPGAVSPAAERLAQDVLRGAAERECCALAWTREPLPSHQTNNPFAQAMTQGTYQLHHPTLGVFPVQLEGECGDINTPSIRPTTAVYGHNLPQMQQPTRNKSGSITLLNPYILSPSSPRAFNPPPALPRSPSRTTGHGSRAGSPTPSEVDLADLATTTDAAADDAVLARLDFTTDSLILNLAALTRFGNPYLVDVAATTLLAVAVAESVRVSRSPQNANAHFEPPPPSSLLSGQKPKSSAASLKESFVEGLEAFGAGKVKSKPGRKWSLRSSRTGHASPHEKDIEMENWYGQSEDGKQKGAKKTKQDKEDGLPFITRTIITVLGVAFKTVVWVLRIGIKIVAGLVVMISRNIRKL